MIIHTRHEDGRVDATVAMVGVSCVTAVRGPGPAMVYADAGCPLCDGTGHRKDWCLGAPFSHTCECARKKILALQLTGQITEDEEVSVLHAQ